MNLRSVETEIVVAASCKDYLKIQNIYIALSSKKIKLDRWFDNYISTFDKRLERASSSDPVKRLYVAKSEEYSKISRIIKIAEVYMKKIYV